MFHTLIPNVAVVVVIGACAPQQPLVLSPLRTIRCQIHSVRSTKYGEYHAIMSKVMCIRILNITNTYIFQIQIPVACGLRRMAAAFRFLGSRV